MSSSNPAAADASPSWLRIGVLFAVTMVVAAAIDAMVADWVVARGDTLRAVGRFFSEGGTARIIVPLTLVGVLRGWVLRRDAILRFVPLFAATFLLSMVASSFFKYFFSRGRPNRDNAGEFHVFQFLDGATSFPSGHATAAFAGAGAIAFAFPKCRWPALILAGIVAVSRVIARRHFPLDVVAGAWLGIAVAWVTAKLHARMMARRRDRNRVRIPSVQPD